MAVKKGKSKTLLPSDQMQKMEIIGNGAVEIYRKWKEAELERQSVAEKGKMARMPKIGAKQAKKIADKIARKDTKKMERGDAVVVKGKKYTFFRFNKKGLAILDPVAKDGERIIVKRAVLQYAERRW